MSFAAGEYQEQPVFFPARKDDLFGVFTRTTKSPNGIAVVFLTGGGWIPATNRNRLSVRLARTVAASGFHAMRIEYHGVGESTGFIRRYSLRRPFVDDVLGAIRWLEGQGISEVVLVGSCFGSRTLLAAVDQIPGLRGVILLAPPVRDMEAGTKKVDQTPVSAYARKAFSTRGARGLLDKRRRSILTRIVGAKLRMLGRRARRRLGPRSRPEVAVSKIFLSSISSLARRRVPALFVYGEREQFFAEFRNGLAGGLGRIVRRAGPLFQLRTMRGTVHGFTHLTVQDQVVDIVNDWLGTIIGPGDGSGAAGRLSPSFSPLSTLLDGRSEVMTPVPITAMEDPSLQS